MGFDFVAVATRFGVMATEQADQSPYNHPASARVFFERRELDQLLSVYGRMVSAGHWRDYAIDGLRDAAVFSVFRRSSEFPLYRIEKRPALARRQGAWSILAHGGLVLKRGHELPQILKYFDRSRFAVVE
jgi:hypothetical protein